MCNEFIAFCKHEIKKELLRSDISKHATGIALLAMSYKSGASDGKGIVANKILDEWILA